MSMASHVPMTTINKLQDALKSIAATVDCKKLTVAARIGLVYVIANETIRECAPEIETIKRDAMAAG